MRHTALFVLLPVLAVSLWSASSETPAADAATQQSSSTPKLQRYREFRRLKRQLVKDGASGQRSSLSSSGPVKRTGSFKYEPYAPNKIGKGQKSLLFFYGLWSIPARANDATLKQWSASGGFIIPAYKVEYDDEVALKKLYGVTQINTFVLVDERGDKVQLLKSPYSAALSFILYGR